MSTDPDKAKEDKDDSTPSETPKDETAAQAPPPEGPAAEEKPAKPAPKQSTKAKKTSGSKSGSTKASSAKSASADTASTSGAGDQQQKKSGKSGDSGDSGSIDWNLRGQMLLRGLLMILAAIAVEISIFLLYVMTVAHFFYQLVMAKPLDRVTELCGRLSAFSHKLLDFIGYHSDKPVFPFAPFPEASPQDEDEKAKK